MAIYPICLNQLHRALCVVVGGGEVAERKVRSLLEVQARVKLISPTVTEGLRRWADEGIITYLPRAYQEGDLEGTFLTIAATDDPAANRAVAEEAESRRSLINVVDDPFLSNFFVPAIVRRGSLTLSVSTDGQSPALAAHIREQLEDLFGPEYASLLDILGELRERVSCEYPPAQRRDLWYRLLESDLLELLREGKIQQARQRATDIVATYTEESRKEV